MRIDIVVTRHPALIEHLREIGLADDHTNIINHATPDQIRGKRVCGVLPHSLSCLAKSFTEVPLVVPAELRGKELTLEQIREYALPPVTYRVFTREDFEAGCDRCTYAACADGAPPINFKSYF